MNICEAPILNSWIRQPADTWSNIAFIITGLYLLIRYRNQLNKRKILLAIPLSSILIGICSFIYHASYSDELLVLDDFGIWIFITIIVSFNLKKITKFNINKILNISFILVVIPLTIMIIFQGTLGTIMVTGFYFIALILELITAPHPKNIFNYKYFYTTIILQIIALMFWILDKQKILCNPQNHIFQYHVLWHILNALAIFFIFKHYYHISTHPKLIQKDKSHQLTK